MADLPAVRGLSDALRSNGIAALLINIHDDVGRVLAPRFEFVSTPTFLVFRPDGSEALRSHGVPSLQTIQAALAG
jgi:hypothetical protein